MLFHILPFLSLGCKPAEGAGSAQYAGAGTEPETTAFGVFDGMVCLPDNLPASVCLAADPWNDKQAAP